MTPPAHPGRMLFLTLPVADVDRSTAFFAGLGFPFDPAFAQEGAAACMRISEQASAMLLSRETFAQYSHRPLGDPATHALAMFTFGVDSREEVDRVSAVALAAGATEADGAEDHGFMYTRSFFDLDGHQWQIMWADPAPADGPPAEVTASA